MYYSTKLLQSKLQAELKVPPLRKWTVLAGLCTVIIGPSWHMHTEHCLLPVPRQRGEDEGTC